jgi:hypothetical protein
MKVSRELFEQFAPVKAHIARAIADVVENSANVEQALWFGGALEVRFEHQRSKGVLLYAVSNEDVERIVANVTGRSAIDGADLFCAMAGFDEDLMLAIKDAGMLRQMDPPTQVQVTKFKKAAR